MAQSLIPQDVLSGTGKLSRVFSDAGVDVTVEHGPGFVAVTMAPKVTDGFKLYISAIDCGREADHNGLIEKLERDLGFKFPGGVPVQEDYSTRVVFPDAPHIALPDGWSYQPQADGGSVFILDDRHRARGWVNRVDRLPDRMFMYVKPQYTFNHDIVASRQFRDGNSLTLGNFWMSSIRSVADNNVLPCFIYVHPAFWPVGACDFTRLNREIEAVRKAEIFIAQQTKKIFPGAAIKAGTEEAGIGGGMTMGVDLPGDLLAHWDDADAEEKMAHLRAVLEAEVPRILGPDNSLVLKQFPTDAEIEAVKANPPDYVAPAPQRWQSAVMWADRTVRTLFSRAP